ncbi:MAG TPA: four helix bundle protein [Cytophagaceae bacterium]
MNQVGEIILKCDHLTEKLVMLYKELESRKQYDISEQLIECIAGLAININECCEIGFGEEYQEKLKKACMDAREVKNMLSFLSLYGIMRPDAEVCMREISDLIVQLSTIQNNHIQKLEIESHV